MSQLRAILGVPQTGSEHRSLWPIAAVILVVVFAPALIAWGLTLLKP